MRFGRITSTGAARVLSLSSRNIHVGSEAYATEKYVTEAGL